MSGTCQRGSDGCEISPLEKALADILEERDFPEEFPAILTRLIQSSKQEAYEDAAKVADAEALAYAENEKRCEAAGNEHGASGDMHAALGCASVAAAIRALQAGKETGR